MEIPKTARQIENSYDWIDIDGSIYSINRRNNQKKYVFKKIQKEISGYMYCGINYKNGEYKTKRVHRIVAQTFIPNPKNYKIVGHKNNIKTDNRVENLYWTTTQENTQKAYEDGLAHNDKGYDDSQSHPVNMYNTYTNELLGEYGSVTIASQETGISKNTISRQAKYKRPVRKPYYFRFQNDIDCDASCQLVGKYDYDTNELVEVYYNIREASKKTGYSQSTISQQCKTGKPKNKFSKYYFNKIKNVNNN